MNAERCTDENFNLFKENAFPINAVVFYLLALFLKFGEMQQN